MDLTLSEEARRMIEAKVASGAYRDAAEVVEHALTLLDAPPAHNTDEGWIGAAIEEALASGAPIEVDLDGLRTRLKAGLPWRP